MPVFQYQYVDAKGKRRSGAIEAGSDGEAKIKLRDQGVIITKLTSRKVSKSKEQLKGDNLAAFTMQLSQLINAGLPLYESLSALEEQSRGDPYHRVILSLCEQVKMGVSLSTAMTTYPGSFDRLYCGMVAAGEAVGSLGSVLEKLTHFLGRQMKLQKQIKTAMIYPAILGGFSFLIVAMLLGFVVPSLEGIFADRPLNGFTSAIFVVSYVFRTYWWLYVPMISGLVYGTIWLSRSERGKDLIEKTALRTPVLKTLMVQTAVARFCRTLGSLLQGGLTMMDALRIARTVMRNATLEREIQSAETRIIEGRHLSQELRRSAYIPPMVSRMIAVGEESGNTAIMLGRIADLYEQELEKTLDRLMALSQPVILIVMGLIIGTVLLAILLPLTDVSSFSVG